MSERPARGRHRLVVDRHEGDLVVVETETGAFLDLPRWLLPPRVKEGDVLVAYTFAVEAGWRVDFVVDAAATRAARERSAATLERLRGRDPGGDVEL